MTDATVLKKPCSAYWIWLGDNRERIATTLGSKKVSDVAKKGGELWKEISHAERAPYDKKAAEQKDAYEKFIATDEGKKALLEKKSSQADAKTDKNDKLCKAAVKAVEKDDALKKPASGYWLWLGDNREKIVKMIGTAKGSDVSKKGGEMWKGLGEKDKLPYENKAKEQKAAYEKYIASDEGKEKLQAFKDATQSAKDQFKAKEPMKPKNSTSVNVEDDSEECTKDEKVPETKKAAPGKENLPKKRAKAPDGVAPPAAKRGRPAAAAQGPVIATDLLKEAEGLGLASQLKNLAARADIAASGKSPEQMLAALKGQGGLVNKAKAALLGA